MELHNEDLGPVTEDKKTWGWFEIFNVWSNDIQSLFGYTLAASLFLSYGLSGWSVFSAILVAGLFVMVLVNLMGKPSVQHGIPFPVMARASMGVKGANFPAVLRAVVAIFWYGAQTYFASTALSLLIKSLMGIEPSSMWLGMTGIDWVSFLIVWSFQIFLFMRGIDTIAKFLNFAGVFVYAVMIVLALLIWNAAGSGLMTEVGTIFQGVGAYSGTALSAWFAVVGTMIAYFAAVVINYGDFSRFVKSEKEMKKGNLLGLPLNIAFFSLIALVVTAGTIVVFGEPMTNPTDIVAAVGSLPLTIVAAIAFFFATVGINMVANFIPPAYDLANLSPAKIDFKLGGLITSAFALVIGGLWVSVVSQMGIFNFVNTFGAVLAPIYGIMMVDHYMIKKEALDVDELFNASEDGEYYYDNGWNKKALAAWALPAAFSLGTVWLPVLGFLSGFGWVIGAALGGIIYFTIMKK